MAAGGKEMEIAIRIAGKVESSFKNALGAATKGIGGITKAVSAATAAAASAVGAIGAASVNVGKEFETAMSQVSATMLIDKSTKEGAETFAALEEAARKCGRETAFSAGEAAEALNNLAMAGYSADDSATALPTVLNLAGAGCLELADSARYITAGLASLGIDKTEDNFNHFADTLAITASKAKTDVAQLGDAITTLGGTGKGLAGGTEEIAASLGILADADITGAEGGTHLRNMILALQNPRNADAAKMFQQLGIEAYTSEGKMRGLNEIFGDISESMEGMTDQQKNNVMSTIFKQTDLAAANAMLADCGSRFDELYEAAENSSEGIGAAAKMYAIQMDNLEGDIDILKSGLSDLGIGIYKDLNGPLREAAQSATAMVGELSTAFESGGMAGMAGAVGGCLSEAVGAIAAYAPMVVSMGIGMLQSFIGGIVQNSGSLASAAAGMLSVFINGLFTMVPQVIFAGIDMMMQFVQSITGQVPQLISGGIQAVAGFAQGIMSRLPEVAGTAIQLIGSLTQGIQDNLPGLIPAAMNALMRFSGSLRENAGKLVDAGLKMIMTLAGSLIDNIPVFVQTIPTIITNIAGIINDNAPKLLSSGIQLVIKLVVGIIKAIPTIVMNIPKIIQAIVAVFTAFNWLSLGSKIITSLGNGIKTAFTKIPQIFRNFIQNAHNTVSSFGWSSLGRGIVMTIGNGIKSLFTMIPQLLKNIGSFAINAIKNIDWWSVGVSIIQFIGEAISGAGGMLWDAIKGIGNGIAEGFKSLFGGGDDEASKEGEKAAESYADGVKNASDAAEQTSLFGSFFGEGESSKAEAAGAQTGAAFGEGLSNGMNSVPADTGGILGSETLGTDLAAAGAADAEAYTAGFNEGFTGWGLDAGTLTDGMASLDGMTEAGMQGAEAISSGMTDNSMAITAAANTLGTEVNTALDGSWQQVNASAQSSMQKLTATVTAAAHSTANAVKAAFENMIITVPKPRLPVISVSNAPVPFGEGGSIGVPQFSVSWNALGGIFDKPTIFNTSAGMQGVGEAGAEAILPLDTLWTQLREIVSQTVQENSGISMIDALTEKLRGIGSGGSGGNHPQLAGAGGPNITYSPVYNLYGNTSKEDVVEANSISQARFNKMMKQYQKEKSRRDL